MHDCVGSELADAGREAGRIENVTDVIHGGTGGLPRWFAIEATNHHSLFNQILDQGRPYEAGTPGDQNFLHGKQTHSS